MPPLEEPQQATAAVADADDAAAGCQSRLVPIQKQHLLAQPGVLAHLKSSITPTALLRLPDQIRRGLALNQSRQGETTFSGRTQIKFNLSGRGMARRAGKTVPKLELMAALLAAMVGCTAVLPPQPAHPPAAMAPAYPYHDYACFVQSNMAAIDHIYGNNYVPVDFVVDTDDDSALVQSLLVPFIALELPFVPVLTGDEGHLAQMLYTYIRLHFTYVAEPQAWQSADETFRLGRGDCKNLSLLLMSLLVAFDLDAFAAISSGHMWVNVHYGGRWHVLELDPHPERRAIYQLPGFYDRPLYKVYAGRTLKRLKRRR